MSRTSSPPSAGDPAAARGAAAADSRRWWALVVIGVAQLLVVLDATIVNIALPSAQSDLGMSDADRQWVITAYTMAFGGLLLLGGRVADLLGHRRAFMIALCGFGLASLLAGAAPDPGVLFAGRALQGIFAALLAPAALALISTTFTDPRERAKAFGVYGALSGGGAAIGLLAGGVLTEYLDWRWCLYINTPIAWLALLGCGLLARDIAHRGPRHLDIPGTLLGCGGLLAVVYAVSEAEAGIGDPLVGVLFLVGVALLGLFVLTEMRSRHPLLPLRVVAHRGRGGSFLAVGLSQVGLFGLFLFMTYYLQVILGYSAVVTGLAFLPLTAGIVVGASVISSRLLPRVQPRSLITPALLAAAVGMAWLTRLEPDMPNVFLTHLLPAQILIGVGIGCVMMPAMSTATYGVAPDDAGVAAALVNTAQQVGGSIGIALLNTISTSVTSSYLDEHGDSAEAVADGTVQGYTVAIGVSVAILVVTAVIAWLLIDTRPSGPEPTGEAGPDRESGDHPDGPPEPRGRDGDEGDGGRPQDSLTAPR